MGRAWRRRLHMDVIDFISKDVACPTIPGSGPADGSAFPGSANRPRLDEFLAEIDREVGLTDQPAPVGESPARQSRWRGASRTRATTSSTWSSPSARRPRRRPRRRQVDLADLPLPVLKRDLELWQVGLANVGWNRSTRTTTTSHERSRASATTATSTGCTRPRPSRRCSTCTRHTLRLPGRGARHDEPGFDEIGHYRDIEWVNYHAAALVLASTPRPCCGRLRSRAATTPHADAVGRHGTPASRPEPSLPVNPDHTTINAAAAQAVHARSSPHYQELIALRHTHPVVVDGRFELLLPDHEQLWVITRTLGRERLLVLANCSSYAVAAVPDDLPSARRGGGAARHPPGLLWARPRTRGSRASTRCRTSRHRHASRRRPDLQECRRRGAASPAGRVGGAREHAGTRRRRRGQPRRIPRSRGA